MCTMLHMTADAAQVLADLTAEITRARGDLEQLLDRRDATIRAELAAGTPYADLMRITGLSRSALDAIRKGRRRR
jgi:hypothetical protein